MHCLVFLWAIIMPDFATAERISKKLTSNADLVKFFDNWRREVADIPKAEFDKISGNISWLLGKAKGSDPSVKENLRLFLAGVGAGRVGLKTLDAAIEDLKAAGLQEIGGAELRRFMEFEGGDGGRRMAQGTAKPFHVDVALGVAEGRIAVPAGNGSGRRQTPGRGAGEEEGEQGAFDLSPLISETEKIRKQVGGLFRGLPTPDSIGIGQTMMNETFFGAFGTPEKTALRKAYGEMKDAYWKVDGMCGAAIAHGKEGDAAWFAKDFSSAAGLYQKYLGKVGEYRQKLEEYDVGVGDAFSRALDAASVFAIPFALYSAGASVARVGLTQGLNMVGSSLATKEFWKRALIGAGSAAALFTGANTYDTHRVNSALEKFGEDPLKAVQDLRASLQEAKSNLENYRGNDKQKLSDAIDSALGNLSRAEGMLKDGKNLDAAAIAEYFVQSLATFMVFEVGFRTLRAVKPKAAAPKPEVERPPEVKKSTAAPDEKPEIVVQQKKEGTKKPNGKKKPDSGKKREEPQSREPNEEGSGTDETKTPKPEKKQPTGTEDEPGKPKPETKQPVANVVPEAEGQFTLRAGTSEGMFEIVPKDPNVEVVIKDAHGTVVLKNGKSTVALDGGEPYESRMGTWQVGEGDLITVNGKTVAIRGGKVVDVPAEVETPAVQNKPGKIRAFWERTRGKTKSAWEKTKAKSKNAWEKTKETTEEMTDKAKEKLKKRREAKAEKEVSPDDSQFEPKGAMRQIWADLNWKDFTVAMVGPMIFSPLKWWIPVKVAWKAYAGRVPEYVAEGFGMFSKMNKYSRWKFVAESETSASIGGKGVTVAAGETVKLRPGDYVYQPGDKNARLHVSSEGKPLLEKRIGEDYEWVAADVEKTVAKSAGKGAVKQDGTTANPKKIEEDAATVAEKVDEKDPGFIASARSFLNSEGSRHSIEKIDGGLRYTNKAKQDFSLTVNDEGHTLAQGESIDLKNGDVVGIGIHFVNKKALTLDRTVYFKVKDGEFQLKMLRSLRGI